MERIRKYVLVVLRYQGAGLWETLKNASVFFYCANTKDCIVKTRFSTDDYNFFLVNECKVSYQRSHMLLTRISWERGHADVLTGWRGLSRGLDSASLNILLWCLAPSGGSSATLQAWTINNGHLDIFLNKHFLLSCVNICDNTSLPVFFLIFLPFKKMMLFLSCVRVYKHDAIRTY